MKKFKNGLIVGKFSPLHHGHEYLIRTALDNCEKLYILSYTNPEFEGYEAGRRDHWLKQLFPQTTVLAFAGKTPPNNASDYVQREFASQLCRDKLQMIPDVVFTSESYGDGFAEHLSKFFNHPVKHIEVDRERKLFPISGTKLRANIHGNRQFLSPFVYADFVKTVCFLGGESSGKSTITALMAKHYDTAMVEEYGRTLSEEKNNQLMFDDLLHIAKTHIVNEENQRLKANRFLFVDTSPLTTMFYSGHLFSKVEPELVELANRKYDYVFYCHPDFPHVQDGTREGDELRQKQHQWYLEELKERGIKCHDLSGDVENRKNAIINILGTNS